MIISEVLVTYGDGEVSIEWGGIFLILLIAILIVMIRRMD